MVGIGVFELGNIAASVARIPAGRLVDGRGAVQVLATGAACFLLSYRAERRQPGGQRHSGCPLDSGLPLPRDCCSPPL